MTPRLSAAFSVPVRRCLAEMLERRVLLANVPDGFTDTILVDELHSPTSMEIAPDGRVFVAGQAGHLWSVAGGEATFVHRLSNVNSEAEHGFLGLVFDEGFATNGFLYVYYTRNGNGGVHNRVSRLTVSGSEVTAEQTIIDLPDIQDADFHMGGALHFGPDGKLYVAVGDYERRTLPQSLDSLAGKILRINKDGSIPSDNPFYNTASGVNRVIWARGLRNPFTFNIHPRTGQMFINDVGQESWEEVNVGQAGANYGWPMSEGPQNTDGFTAPIHYYNHDSGTCSVAGGVFYHAANMSFPQPYHDKYFFGDLCGNWARIIDPVTFQVSEFATGIQAPVDFNVGPDGSLYYLGRGQGLDQGHVGRISHAQAGAPVILDHPDDVSVSPGQQATFNVTATGGGGALGFQWQRDGQDIPGATAATLTIAAVRDADAGAYRVVVTNGVGSVTSNPATLTVGGQGEAPVAIIGEPTASRKFRGGQRFRFSGSGADAEDGALTAQRMTWQVDYHTGEVVRPFFPATSGVASGSFMIPDETPFKTSNVFYRVRLTVSDSDGNTSTTTRDVHPVVARVALRSNVPGAVLFTDGETRQTPTAFNTVAGIRRVLAAQPVQEIGGVSYLFDGWSDGGDREHSVLVPDGDVTYVARWREAPAPAQVRLRGLTRTIFNNRDRTGTVVVDNIDTIDFDYGEAAPHRLIHPDTFFARFRGKVQPAFTGTYTFHAAADDGVRLFVNGELLVDQWGDSDGSELSGTIDLVAGQKYDLRFDHFDNTGASKAILMWESDSTPRQVIPRNRLFTTVAPRTLYPTADAHVQGGSASRRNLGGASALYLKHAPDVPRYDRQAYMKFDVSDLDVSSTGSAKLRVFGRVVGGGVADRNLALGLFEAPGAKWGERGITYDTRPDTSAAVVAAAVVNKDENQWWEFDVTSWLRAQRAAGRSILTLALRNLDTSSAFTVLHSRQGSFNGPQLVLTA